STGASCDDYSGVEQLVQSFAPDMLWVEEPMRCDARATGPLQELLVKEYERVVERMEKLTGHAITNDELREGVSRANRVRRLVWRLRELAFRDAALAALEMMVVEFGNLHYYSDMGEWTAVLEHLLATAEDRAAKRERVLPEDALRVVWVTPPADPLLLTYVEDAGARVVGTEYVINQALEVMDESKPPLEAVAESFMAASLIGSSRARAQAVIHQARKREAEGVIVSGIFGGSHCAMEGRLIADYVKAELDLPVLEFDVTSPSREVSRQIGTRVDAFLEVLRSRR
ncbi:2-hydroxyacyl-CoA dehydratase, partial [candidate division WOR-3 bacterium]|nr:2-hydroxyacyl-CoA dehydratase [candidate division WOR-3 bacterium]